MLLYHGSPYRIDKLEERQASSPTVSVPEGETLKGIYFTPDYGFAVACGGRPMGVSNISDDEKTIEFENPELFNPEQEVYIYSINSENIPSENIEKIDEHQFRIFGLNELVPESMETIKAIEVEKYYKFLNWKPKDNKDEEASEINFKIR
jgi:hypothetical protein